MTAYLTIVNGQTQRVQFPLRSAGFIQTYTGALPTSGFLLEFDGYWVALTLDAVRTIGNGSSGAHIAQVWAQTLFTHLWNSYDNTQCPVSTASGTVARQASAIADWNSNRRITLPDFRGRVVMGAGTGGNLTTRAKGSTVGAETHTLSINEMPSHNHTPTGGVWAGVNSSFNLMGGGNSFALPNVSLNNVGGGQAHNNIQPSAVEHLLISTGAR